MQNTYEETNENLDGEQLSSLEEASAALPKSKDIDIIDNNYRILIDRPIPELKTDFAQYYYAISLHTQEEFFAIALENFFLYPFEQLQKFINSSNQNIILPNAASLVQLSNKHEWKFVIIVPKYDYTSTLEKLIEENGNLSNKLLIEEFIPSFESIFKYADTRRISLGNINPQNIIYQNNKFILREFYTHYENFYQDSYLLPIEIFDCLPYARVTENSSADAYAFGTMLVYACIGEKTWLKHTEEAFKNLRFENSSFNTFVGKSNISDDIKNLLKGLLYDNPVERWRSRGIKDWLQGKSTKMTVSSNIDAISPLSFNENSYGGCKHLARGFFQNWDYAHEFIKEERLIKWVQRNVSKTRIVEDMTDLADQIMNSSTTKTDKSDKLFKTICVLDPAGPIRLRQIAASFLSIPQLVSYIAIQNKQELLHTLNEILLKRYPSFLLKYSPNSSEYQDYLQEIEAALKYYTPELGMIIERLMYSLNPHLPCLSPYLEGKYVTNVTELIKSLDEIAENNPNSHVMDKHIMAFVSDRIGIKRDIKVGLLKPYPEIVNSYIVNALTILLLAQGKSKTQKAVHLAKFLASKLEELMNKVLYNKHIRQLFSKDLAKAAEEGSLEKLLHVISNTALINHDLQGYNKACHDLAELNGKIRIMTDEPRINEIGYFFGLRFTVLFSYCLLFLVTLTIALF
jgi:hypothetical protein